MNKREYELVFEVQDKHWWWIGRKALLEAIFQRYLNTSQKCAVADVGCGFGANIPMLRQYGDVTGLELNKEAIDELARKWGDSVQGIIWKSPQKIEKKFDLILLADVIEHIPNDKEAVDWIYDQLLPGGIAVITTPAFEWLWSEMDDVVQHYRRYSLKSLTALFSPKFEVLHATYYNFILFPIKVLFVGFSRLRGLLYAGKNKRSFNDVPLSIINRLFKYVLYFESRFTRSCRFPFGASLILVVRRSK